MKTKSNRPEVQKGLQICFKITNMVKEQFPNEVFAIKQNSIVPFTSNKRLCNNTSLGGSFAHFHNTKPHRVCCKQNFLINGRNWHSEYEFGRQKRGTGYYVNGTLGYVLLIVHELAHHRTKGHGKKWVIKCKKFQNFMINQLISGEYYKYILPIH